MSTKELTHKDICPYYEDNCINVGCVCPKYQAYEKVNQPGEVEKKIESMGIDMTQGRLHIMMSMQFVLAQKFHEVVGLTKDEIDHWIKEYDVCITDEITEVHEHLSIFPGNISKDNLLELQKEFIDIWHFLMDEFIVSGINANKLYHTYLNLYTSGDVPDADPLEFIFKKERNNLKSINHLNDGVDKYTRDSLIHIYTSQILAGMRAVRQQISWKHWKKPSATINFDKLHSAMVTTFRALVQCFILSGLDTESLYQIYVVKNCENFFRQEFNY